MAFRGRKHRGKGRWKDRPGGAAVRTLSRFWPHSGVFQGAKPKMADMIKNRLRQTRFLLIPIAAGVLIAGCGSSSTTSVSAGGSSASASEAASAATGDIPDNQQFLRYTNSAAGYSLVYPQGWARKGSSNDVTFSDKDNSVQVQITKGSSPTVSSVTAELKKEAANDPTLQPGQPQQVQLPSGPAIHVVYHVPNAVNASNPWQPGPN